MCWWKEAQTAFLCAAPSLHGAHRAAAGGHRSALPTVPALPEAAQRQIPSASISLGISRGGGKAPAHRPSPLVDGKPEVVARDDSCRGLKPFRLLSPSPLMTADLRWVDSYFRGLSEGSKVSRDESGLTEASSVTTAGEVSVTGMLRCLAGADLQERLDSWASRQAALSSGSRGLSAATSCSVPASPPQIRHLSVTVRFLPPEAN